MSGYSTAEAAELVGLKPAQIRGLVRAGLLSAATGHSPHQRYRFSFQDIVLLRMAKQLHSANAGSKAITRALRNLKSRLPNGKPLSSVRVVVEDRKVLVQEAESLWHPESGQMQIDFSMSTLTREVTPLVKEAARFAESSTSVSADECYNLGIDLEMVGDMSGAENLYRKAVKEDRGHADAWVNLGRLVFIAGDTAEAVVYFRRAIDIDPQHSTAWFNLGVVQEQEGSGEARSSYENAIAADPDFADAHYNLAGLYESLGDKRAALRHLVAYRNKTER